MQQELATRDELLTLVDFLADELDRVMDEHPCVTVDWSLYELARHVVEQG